MYLLCLCYKQFNQSSFILFRLQIIEAIHRNHTTCYIFDMLAGLGRKKINKNAKKRNVLIFLMLQEQFLSFFVPFFILFGKDCGLQKALLA